MSTEKIREILLVERPGVVGISCFTFNRSASIELARLVKATLGDVPVVLGGPHPTHVGPTMLQNHSEIDLCVAGEGELTLAHLVRVLSDGGDPRSVRGLFLRQGGASVATPPADFVADLDSLPFPALHGDGYGVDPQTQYPYVVTSRGCPAKCSFCSSPEFWGSGVRFRSARNILDELQLLRERFGILYVSFRDDIFALNKKRVIDLCRGMIERRLSMLWDCQTRVNTIDEERLIWMKRAGALIVQYGIESGSQRILDRLQKGQQVEQIDRAAEATRRVGLVLSIYLVTGVPGESEEDVALTEAMIRRIRPHDGIVTPLAIFPGTPLWDEYRAARAAGDDFWDGVGHDGVFARPDRFTEDAVLRLSALLESGSAVNAYAADEYAAHRALAGECYATDLMEGESLQRMGDAALAAGIYGRLALREPWNPWPCLRMGNLALAAGDASSAEEWAGRALAIVPSSGEARGLLKRAEQAGKRAHRGLPRVQTPALADPPSATGTAKRARSSRAPSRGFQAYPPPRGADRGDLPS